MNPSPKSKFSFALALVFGGLLGAQSFQPPGDTYFTYIDRHWWDFGVYFAPGIWISDEEKVGLGGLEAGLTMRKRVPAARVGSIFELGFMRYESSVSNLTRKSMASGTDALFLPSVFTWSLFLNSGRYSRQMGALAPFFGLGIALLNHRNFDGTNQVKNGAAAFGNFGVEMAGLPPTIALRLSLRLGAESLGSIGQEPLSAIGAGFEKPVFFFSFSARLVLYLG
jgi:hypothetical protein